MRGLEYWLRAWRWLNPARRRWMPLHVWWWLKPPIRIYSMTAASLSQVHFRFRNDDGSESAATWVDLEDTNSTLDVDTNYRLRFTVDDTASGGENNVTFRLQYNLLGAGYNDVTATSTVVRASASANFAEADDTTRQLTVPTGGSFITPNGCMDEVDGLTSATLVDYVDATHDFVEAEFCFQIRSADVANNDTIEFRLIRSSAVALENYAVTPQATVSEGAGGTIVAPGVIATTTTAPAASVSAGATVTPAAIAASTTSPAASTTAGANLTPATIATVAALPAPTVDTGGGSPAFGAVVTSTKIASFTGPTVSGSNTLGIVAVHTGGLGTVESVTWGGPSMTRVTPSASRYLHIFKISGPASAATITVSQTAPEQFGVAALYWSDAGDVVQSADGSSTGGTEATATCGSNTTSGSALALFASIHGNNAQAETLGTWEVNGSVTGVTEAYDIGVPGAGTSDLRYGAGYDDDAGTGSTDSMSVTPSGTLDLDVTVIEVSAAGGASTVTPATISAATASPQATAAAAATITPSTIARTFTTPAATVQAGALVTPAVTARAFTIPQVTILAGGAGTATPATIARLFDLPAATASTPGTATPNTVAVTFSLPSVSVAGGAVVGPVTVNLAFTIPQATPIGGGGGVVTPAAIARAFTLPQSAVAAGAAVTPDVIARAVQIAQATAASPNTTLPSVLAAILIIPQATATGAGRTQPATVARSFTLQGVTVTGAAEVAPGVIALQVLIPQVIIGEPPFAPLTVTVVFGRDVVTTSFGRTVITGSFSV